MIERKEYMEKIEPFIDKDLIKVITGMRRSGKSVFLKHIIEKLKNKGIKEDNIIYINLESIKYKNIKKEEELDKIIIDKTKNIKGKYYLLFDEIQRVQGWENSINSYFASFDADIYITGSNSNLLSGELATYLSGRYIEVKLYPFSFKEALLMNKNKSEEEVFKDYLKLGGIPYIFELENEKDKIEYLERLYDSIILRDVIGRNNVRNIELLDRIINYIIDNIGRTFSAKNISDFLKHERRSISSETVYNYLNYCENASIIHKVKRENVLGKQILKTQEKYYLTDHGFKEVVFRNNIKSKSQILENIVYIELLRRGYKITIGKLYDKEIDFICKKRDELIYIQVCSTLDSEKTKKREFEPLLKIKDNYDKYIISTDDYDLSYNGIKHKNIIEFLKED